MPIMKVIGLNTVWEEKIFKDFLLYLRVKSGIPQQRANFNFTAIISSILIVSHYIKSWYLPNMEILCLTA